MIIQVKRLVKIGGGKGQKAIFKVECHRKQCYNLTANDI
jgi:hypothetical protein